VLTIVPMKWRSIEGENEKKQPKTPFLRYFSFKSSPRATSSMGQQFISPPLFSKTFDEIGKVQLKNHY